MKQPRMLGFWLFLGLSAALLSACISDESRGWAAPVPDDNQQIVSATKARLNGIDTTASPIPAWTGELSQPLGQQDSRLQSVAISPTDTPFQGDLLRIESEVVRIRSLNINGAERELLLDRGFGGTVASAHPAGSQIEALRRSWRFPDDWHIREGGARGLDGVYGTPILGSDGILYVGDYGGWVYAFNPADVNLDAANDDNEPDTALVDLGEQVIGGLALDEDNGRLYVTAGDSLYSIATDRLKAALAAGGGVIEPELTFTFKAGDALWGAPVVEDGTVYLTSLDGHLYSLDASSGGINWAFDAGKGLPGTPVIAGDLVLVGGFEAELFGVNKSDGSLEWQYATSNWILATPTLVDNTTYFGDFDSVLHAVNAQTGEAEWSLPLERGKIRAGVAVSGDYVVVGTDGGWLIGVDRTSQQRVWEVNLETDIHADLVTAGDEVLLAPDSCVELPGGAVDVYYRAVDPSNGTLKRVEGIC